MRAVHLKPHNVQDRKQRFEAHLMGATLRIHLMGAMGATLRINALLRHLS